MFWNFPAQGQVVKTVKGHVFWENKTYHNFLNTLKYS